MVTNYKHGVYNKFGTSKPRPVKELTTNLSFDTLISASRHFKIDTGSIKKSADNRAKLPQHPYKFKWITNATDKQESKA